MSHNRSVLAIGDIAERDLSRVTSDLFGVPNQRCPRYAMALRTGWNQGEASVSHIIIEYIYSQIYIFNLDFLI